MSKITNPRMSSVYFLSLYLLLAAVAILFVVMPVQAMPFYYSQTYPQHGFAYENNYALGHGYADSYAGVYNSDNAYNIDYCVSSDPSLVVNIFDPEKQRNERISRYSVSQIASMIGDARFRRMNDIDAVCRTLSYCYGADLCAVNPQTSAQISFVISQPIRPVNGVPAPVHPVTVMYVDPVYPPWSPTYNPYW